jgi:hypothetical protein
MNMKKRPPGARQGDFGSMPSDTVRVKPVNIFCERRNLVITTERNTQLETDNGR